MQKFQLYQFTLWTLDMESNLEHKAGSQIVRRTSIDYDCTVQLWLQPLETFQVQFWTVCVHVCLMNGNHPFGPEWSGIRVHHKPIPQLKRNWQKNQECSISKSVLFLWNCFPVRGKTIYSYVISTVYFKNWPQKSLIKWNAIARDEWW